MRKIKINQEGFEKLLKNLIQEESETSLETIMAKGQSFSQEKREKFKKLCQECIQEIESRKPGFSRDMQVEKVLTGASLLFLAGAALLAFWPVVILAGAGIISTLGVDIIKKWKEVIECVKSKRKELINIQSIDSNIENVSPETKVQIENILKDLKRKRVI